MTNLNQQIKNEVLYKHRRETRLQSLGMVVGIAGTMFIAMNIMDVIKEVKTIHDNQDKILSFVQERKEMPEKVRNFARQEILKHEAGDMSRWKKVNKRLDVLEDKYNE